MLDLDNIEKAQRMSLTTQVEVALKGALIAGSLRPGSRLVTKEIADKLGTSITPVRLRRRTARCTGSGLSGA